MTKFIDIVNKTEWEKTPKSVKKLVKRLFDTLQKVMPDES